MQLEKGMLFSLNSTIFQMPMNKNIMVLTTDWESKAEIKWYFLSSTATEKKIV